MDLVTYAINKKYTDKKVSELSKENAELREDYVQQAYILQNPHQLWDKLKVNYGGYYKCDGTYVKKDGTCNITVDVEQGKTYNFATPDPTTANGITAGTANYICPIKEDGSFLYTSADDSALTWKAYYTVPAGIAKIIVSNPVSRLRNGEYSIVEDAFTPSSANPYAPRYASKTEQLMGSKTHISCLGDSVTAGSGGGGTTYPAVLAANSDSIVVYEMGHPSKNAEYIAMMMGAMGMNADPFTIPAAVSPVTITLRDVTGTAWDIGKHSPAVEPCRIGGVDGVLDYSDNVLTFTRGRAGEAVTFDRPQRVVTNFELRHMPDICIIWAGTNDTPGSIDSENCTTISVIKNMVEWLPHKKYIVIAPVAKSYHSNVANIQVYFKRAFGSHFVNLRQYLLEYGLADAGITPTEQDAADIANGEIPSSLRSDEVHFNAAGYTVIGNYLYKVIEDFGWLDR